MKILSFIIALSFLMIASVQKDFIADKLSGLNEIEKEVLNIARETNIPALQLVIQTSSDSLHLNYHHPDLEAQAVYGIGSSTKLLVSVLVHYLAEQRKINLDETVSKYLDTETAGDFESFGNLTVRSLLNHTSGLADYTRNPGWITSVINNSSPLSFNDKMALVDSSLSNRGTFTYSNTNYLLIEQIVENISGKTYTDILNQFYDDMSLGNIEMQHEYQTFPAYFATDEKASSDVSMWKENYGYDGGIFSTAVELNNFLQKLFIDKEILSESSLSHMQNWIPMAPMEIPIGEGKIFKYGYGLMKLEYGEKIFLGHSGGTLKYQSFLFYDQESGTTITILTNSSGRYYNNVFFQELIPAILDKI